MACEIEEKLVAFVEFLGEVVEFVHDVEAGGVFIEEEFDVFIGDVLGFEELSESCRIAVGELEGVEVLVVGDADDDGPPAPDGGVLGLSGK